MPMTRKPVIVVLAAGRGSRFLGAQHKLLQPLAGASVVGKTIANAVATRLPVLVVTTLGLAAEVSRWIGRRDMVLLPEVGSAASEPLGMGYSIAAGVAARSHAPGWLLLPADMPLLRPASMLAVAAAIEHQPVAYAQHRGRRGHPVGFAAELFSELARLAGDEGARRVIARFPSQSVELDDPGVLQDIDTLADLELLQRAVAAHQLASIGSH